MTGQVKQDRIAYWPLHGRRPVVFV